MKSADKRAIVIGGSLAGLFSGTLLRSIGWQVDIYERSIHDLDSRGGGVVLQPDVVAALKKAGIATDRLGVDATERYYLQKEGAIEKMAMRQTLTSWNILYRSMRRHFPDKHYHQGKVLAQVQSEGTKVTAVFDDGSRETGDLLIGADGPTSTVRQQLLPTHIPQYAGYVAYRGLIDEVDLEPEAAAIFTERFVFYDFPNSHILAYVIPGENESLVPGERRFNWVWYVNYDEKTELPHILTDKNGRLRSSSVPPGLLLLFVFFVGDSLGLIGKIVETATDYVTYIIPLSNPVGRADSNFFHTWTIFYWAWWISWSPFVGMFIARISKGRTVREFIVSVMLAPTLVTIVWMTVFGQTGLSQYSNQVGELSGGISNASLTLFQMLDNLPLAMITSLIAIVLVMVFFITSSDSGSLVIDTITAGGKLESPMSQRVFWAIAEGFIAIALLYGGGTEALKTIQAGSVSTGLPFTFLLIVMCVSLWLGLRRIYKAREQMLSELEKY